MFRVFLKVKSTFLTKACVYQNVHIENCVTIPKGMALWLSFQPVFYAPASSLLCQTSIGI